MKNIILVILLSIMSQTIIAQQILNINSKYLKQKTEIFIYKPNNYQHSKKYPLVFMLHGYSENYKQWSGITDLKKLANDYQMIIVCPEGFTSYYLNSPKLQNSQYEDFFLQELIPKIEKIHEIDSKNIFITGLSMGGYGALSLYIKHPNYFNTAASTSGALELDHNNLQKISLKFFHNERMTDDLTSNLGNPLENDWNKHSISTLLQQNKDFNKGFFLDCGLQDPLLLNTVKIKDIALENNLPIRFSFQNGDHNREYWAKSIEYHFVYFKQHLKI